MQAPQAPSPQIALIYFQILLTEFKESSKRLMNFRINSSYEFGPFSLDKSERLLLRDGQAITLTPKAFETLLLLVENCGHVLTKEVMLSRLWPDTFVEEANLTNNISLLRKALGEDSEGQQYIKTVPRVGYRFVAAVKQAQECNQAITPSVDVEGRANSGTGASASLIPSARIKRWRLAVGLLVGALLVAILIGVLLFRGQGESRSSEAQLATIRSLAVLPLANLSGDPSQDYFVDGMTDELITSLAKIGNLRVISRASAMQYKGLRKPLLDIARELNVDALVDGSVLRSGDRVRISVQLIHGASDSHVWAESYAGDLRDVLALQSGVGRAIANEIRLKLTPQQGLLANAAAVKPPALDAYLRGRDYLNHGINEDDLKQSHELLEKSAGYFEEAVKTDPNFARAYAGLAAAYHWMASSGLPELFPKSKEAASKALQNDDTLAEAHGSLAFVLHAEWDWVGSEREYRRAIELDPNSGHHGYALLLSDLGRHQEAIGEIQLAEKLNPLEIPLKVNMGEIYLFARQYDRAIEQFRQLLNVAPDDPYLHRGLGGAYMFTGMYNKGLAELRQAVEAKPLDRPLLAWAQALAGNRREAKEILAESLKRLAKGEQTSKRNLALVYAALGDKDQAFIWLEKAYQERSGLATLKVHPALDSLRSDPRFDGLLRRIGLQ